MRRLVSYKRTRVERNCPGRWGEVRVHFPPSLVDDTEGKSRFKGTAKRTT